MASLKRVRVIKKVQLGGVWRYVSLKQTGGRYVWDDRPGKYFLEWWEGAKRRRETAGQTPSEVIAAKRRKQDEWRVARSMPGIADPASSAEPERDGVTGTRTPLLAARDLFLKRIEAHSPDKPETVRRYRLSLQNIPKVL